MPETAKRWAVMLVDVADEPGRIFGIVKSYRWRWLAERRCKAEQFFDDLHRPISAISEWQVRDLDAGESDA